MKLNHLYMFQIKSEVQTSVSWSVSSSDMSETPSQNKTIFQINRLQIFMGPKICARTKKDPEMYNPQLKTDPSSIWKYLQFLEWPLEADSKSESISFRVKLPTLQQK